MIGETDMTDVDEIDDASFDAIFEGPAIEEGRP